MQLVTRLLGNIIITLTEYRLATSTYCFLSVIVLICSKQVTARNNND